MTGRRHTTLEEWVDPDDAPYTSTPQWRKKFDKAPVVRGRPPLDDPKVSTTLRLDADIVRRFRSEGPGWQSRINAVLRAWVDTH